MALSEKYKIHGLPRHYEVLKAALSLYATVLRAKFVDEVALTWATRLDEASILELKGWLTEAQRIVGRSPLDEKAKEVEDINFSLCLVQTFDSSVCPLLTHQQVRLVNRALDLYLRMYIGQMEEIKEPWMFKLDLDWMERLRMVLNLAHQAATGIQNGGPGIHNPTVPDEARIAMDLEHVFRHQLAWDEHPNGGTFVQFDKPHLASETLKELPTIEPVT